MLDYAHIRGALVQEAGQRARELAGSLAIALMSQPGPEPVDSGLRTS